MSAWSPRQLLAFLDRVEPTLGDMNHFELLDIDREVTSKQVRRAFHQLASRLHPDLYRLHISARDHERLTCIYARMAEAYLVLRDPETRKDYTYELAQQEKPAMAQRAQTEPANDEAPLPPKARRFYRRAQASLRRGDQASAILELRMAVANAPQSALLRAALDQALGKQRSRS